MSPATAPSSAPSLVAPVVAIRKSIRCPHCELNQYELANGKCRRCSQRLRPEPLVIVTELPILPPLAAVSVLPIPSQAPPLHHTLLFWLPIVLLYLRLQSGMSQSQLAKRMHTNRIWVSKIECAGICPTLYSFERYAKGLGVTMEKVARMCEMLAVKE